MFDTAIRGYRTLSASSDPWLQLRARQMRESAEQLRHLVSTMQHFAHDSIERERVDAAERQCVELFGVPTAKQRALRLAALAIAEAHHLRTRLFDYMPQPKTRLTRFRWPDGKLTLEQVAEEVRRLPLLGSADTAEV
jgi:hypothetical protein